MRTEKYSENVLTNVLHFSSYTFSSEQNCFKLSEPQIEILYGIHIYTNGFVLKYYLAYSCGWKTSKSQENDIYKYLKTHILDK